MTHVRCEDQRHIYCLMDGRSVNNLFNLLEFPRSPDLDWFHLATLVGIRLKLGWICSWQVIRWRQLLGTSAKLVGPINKREGFSWKVSLLHLLEELANVWMMVMTRGCGAFLGALQTSWAEGSWRVEREVGGLQGTFCCIWPLLLPLFWPPPVSLL